MRWDEAGPGRLRVFNTHPGTHPGTHPRTGRSSIGDAEFEGAGSASHTGAWWNIVHTGSVAGADGKPFPKKLVSEVQRLGWEATYGFKLRAGDWLVLDNLAVQHGRLPFVPENGPGKRTLLTVYSNPIPAVAARATAAAV